MQSKISWFKRGILLQDLRAVGWFVIIYQIGLLFSVPLQIIMRLQADHILFNNYIPVTGETHSLFEISLGFQLLIMFVAPVILSAILFRYLQVKIQADFTHSLPIKRTAMYNHHLLIGSVLLVVPIIITAICVAIIYNAFSLEQYFSPQEIVKWAGITILMDLFFYVVTTFIGMIAGITAVQVVLTYIFLIFPAGFLVLLYYNLKYFMYGFPVDYYFQQRLEILSPLIRMGNIDSSFLSWKEMTVYIIITVVVYALGIWVYKKRHVEGATQAIAFRSLKPIFKYGVTFCSMLLGGMYFGEIQNDVFGWVLFGYVFGSLMGYAVAEMILQKTWRIFRGMKGYVIYAVVTLAGGFLLNLDLIGYESNMPHSTADIKSVYFGNSVYYLTEDEQDYVEQYYTNAAYEFPSYRGYYVPIEAALNNTDLNYYQEQDNIESILKLHEKIIENQDIDYNNELQNQRTFFIAYELEDGSHIIRQYQIAEDEYQTLLKPIYESREYKYFTNQLLRLKDGINVDKISIESSHFSVDKHWETVNPEQMEEMVQALKTDMLAESYEDIVSNRMTWGEIRLLLSNGTEMNVSWKKSYRNFDEWLNSHQLLQEARIVPDDIMFAAIVKNPNTGNEREALAMSSKDLKSIFNHDEDMIVIEDAKQLEQCLYDTTMSLDSNYFIAIYYKNKEEPDYYGLIDIPQINQAPPAAVQ